MITRLIGCCFPSDKNSFTQNKVIKFDGNCNQTDSANDEGLAVKLGQQFTIMDQANGQPNQIKSYSNFVDKGSKNILLDRLKIYNESQDYEVFKSKMGNIAKVGATMVVRNIREPSEKEASPSVRYLLF